MLGQSQTTYSLGFPKSADFADGLDDITISTFARAINEVAHRIESMLGKSTNFDTIAYIGPGEMAHSSSFTVQG